ncbi:MAG: hypothetical protein HY323_05455 [Betaproteobacteria bacterium]|nr:hypothetical protein [Betaproteobacteria bacterium]
MRFISQFRNYRVVAVHEQVEILASGQARMLAPGYVCEFRQGDVTDWERDQARELLTFRGTTLNLDGSPTDPIDRVSSFDSAQVADSKLRHKVEQALLAHPAFGKQDGFILIEKPKLVAPWPGYDKLVRSGRRTDDHVAAKVAELTADGGYDPAGVAAYERANLNRQPILDALAALERQPEPEPDLISA